MLKHILRILLSCLMLVYIGFKVDWRVTISLFRQINPGWFLLSVTIALSGSWLRALKYYFLIRDTSISLTAARLVAIQFISRFYALFIPTAIGPEAVRWYKVTKGKKGKSFFLATTVYERVLFMLTLICFGMLPLVFASVPAEIITLRNRLIPVAAGFSALLFFVLLYLFSSTIHINTKQFLKNRLHLRKGGKLDLLLDNLAIKDRSVKLLSLLVLLTICWQISYVTQIYSLFNVIGIPFGIIEATWMGSLVLMLQALPVSFAGLGIREGAYAYLFTLYGLPAEQGVVLGLLFFTQMLVIAGTGGVLNLFEK